MITIDRVTDCENRNGNDQHHLKSLPRRSNSDHCLIWNTKNSFSVVLTPTHTYTRMHAWWGLRRWLIQVIIYEAALLLGQGRGWQRCVVGAEDGGGGPLRRREGLLQFVGSHGFDKWSTWAGKAAPRLAPAVGELPEMFDSLPCSLTWVTVSN